MPAERYKLNLKPNVAPMPGQLLLNNKLSTGARVLAGVILLYQTNGEESPTQEELAATLNVVVRTVQGWIDELRAQKLIKITPSEGDKRRQIYSFLKPRKSKIGDQKFADRKFADQRFADRKLGESSISESSITYSKASGSRKLSKRGELAENSHVGVGVGHDSLKKEEPTTTTPREPLKTRHAKYLLRLNITAAPEFDREDLDSDAVIAAVEHMRRDGLRNDQIVYRLRLDPPSLSDPHWRQLADEPAPTGDEPPSAGDDQAGDQFDHDRPDPALVRLWNDVLSICQSTISRQEFNTWFRLVTLESLAGGTATIATPNAIVKDGIEARYLGPLRDLLSKGTGKPVQVRVITK